MGRKEMRKMIRVESQAADFHDQANVLFMEDTLDIEHGPSHNPCVPSMTVVKSNAGEAKSALVTIEFFDSWDAHDNDE
tara:strand:+ start:8474 stop:8707 length:234 start_codon:yes stop_codon:yes gene_type:complete